MGGMLYCILNWAGLPGRCCRSVAFWGSQGFDFESPATLQVRAGWTLCVQEHCTALGLLCCICSPGNGS
jgi:hypothetical protein